MNKDFLIGSKNNGKAFKSTGFNHLISLIVIRASINLYRNAYSGLSTPMWWLAAVMFVNRAGTMVMPFLTVYLKEYLHFSITQAAWEIALFGIGAIIGNFVGGKLTDAIGFARVQFWSLLLNGLLFIVLGFLQTFFEIALCMFVIGIVGEAFRPANATAIATYSSAENRTRSYSLNRLAINLGFSIGPALGGLLSYGSLFWVDGITCIVAALGLHLALPAKKVVVIERTKSSREKTASAWRDRVYLQFSFFVFLTAVCFMQMFSMLPLFYKEHLQLSKPSIGILLGLNGMVVAIVEMVMVFKLEGKRSHTHYISFGALLMGLSFAMLNLPVMSVLLPVCAMLTITFGEMLMFPFINAYWVGRSTPANRGAYAAIYSMCFAFSQILSPPFAASVAQHFGYNVLWYTNFAICAIVAVGFYNFKKHYQ